MASRGGSFSESVQSIALFINVSLKLKTPPFSLITADRLEVRGEKHASQQNWIPRNIGGKCAWLLATCVPGITDLRGTKVYSARASL